MRLGTPNFNPVRLVEAREVRGVTGKSLALLVGVTPASISNYENGRQTPSVDVLDAIADKLEFPTAFFLAPEEKSTGAPIFFRSLSTATKKGKAAAGWRLTWASRIVKYLTGYLDLPAYNVPSDLLGPAPLEASQAQVEQAAAHLRRHWGIGDGSISDVVLLMENNGVVATRHRLYDDREDGLSQKLPDGLRDYVLLNADKGLATRSRFDAAHELAHLVLHSSIDEATKNANHKALEKQAHAFAGAFLLPASSFGQAFAVPSLEVFARLKPRWRVSVAAMAMRSRELGLLDDDELSKLMRSYRYKKWHKAEPGDDDIAPERPRLLRRAIETLITHRIQTRQDVVEAIRLPVEEIESVSGLPTGYLEREPGEIIEFPSLRPKEAGEPAPPDERRPATIHTLDPDWPARRSN